MRWIAMCIIVGCLLSYVTIPSFAQVDACSAVVFYHQELGENTGDCTDSRQPCRTLEYALSQGQTMCPTEVNVFYEDPDNPIHELLWRPPTASNETQDRIIVIVEWVGPAFGLTIGWLIAWGLVRQRRQDAT